jgi:MoxR-like ATPase
MTTRQNGKGARAALARLRDELNQQFPERRREIDSCLAAFLVRENVFLGGPPGTAKSRMAEAICTAFGGDTKNGDYFKYQFHSQSVASEVTGGRDFDQSRDGAVVFNTVHKLPEASVALLDEIFKAHSVLQVLLRLLEEHEFDRDSRHPENSRTPLRLAIGASNELPEELDLEALFDRFLARHWVSYVRDPNNMVAIMAGTVGANPQTRIMAPDVAFLEADAQAVSVSDSALQIVLDIKAALEKQGVVASDRRWRKIIKMLRAYAYVEGLDEVNDDVLAEKLADMLWREVKDRPAIDAVVRKIANPTAAAAKELLDAAIELVHSLPPVEEKTKFLAALATATAELGKMKKKLTELGTGRAVQTALAEVKQLETSCKAQGAKAFGISL